MGCNPEECEVVSRKVSKGLLDHDNYIVFYSKGRSDFRSALIVIFGRPSLVITLRMRYNIFYSS